MMLSITRLLLAAVLLFATSLPAQASKFGISKQIYEKYLQLVNQRGDTVGAPELKDLIIAINKNLDQPAILQARKTNRTLFELLRIFEISQSHVNLVFNINADNYPYPIPFNEPFPIRYTLNVIEDGIHILNMLQKTIPGFTMDPELVMDAGEFTWFDVIQNSTYNQYRQRTTGESLPGLTDAETRVVATHEDMFTRSAESYIRHHQRLIRFGETVGFPEFEETITTLEHALYRKDVEAKVKNNPLLQALRQQVEEQIAYLKNPSSPKDNPVLTSRKVVDPWAYRLAVEVSGTAVRFFDIVERLKYKETDDHLAVERSWHERGAKRLINQHYHYDRYAYHWISIAEDPDMVILITNRTLSFDNLIDSRVVPYGVIGCESTVERADRYFFSPINFRYHDINHDRRIGAFTRNYLNKMGITQLLDKYREYQHQDSELKQLKARVAALSMLGRYNSIESHEIRKFITVILFEILHETALNFDRESLIGDILKKPNTPQPFEFMSYDPKTEANLKQNRMIDGNLISGVQFLVNKFDGNPLHVTFIRDKALSLLSEITNKLNYGFYDSVFKPKDDYGRVAFRTPKYVGLAAKELLTLMGIPNVSEEYLIELAGSRIGMEELYKAHYGFNDQGLFEVRKTICQKNLEVQK